MTGRPTIADAARNNAEWCDIVCATHGRPGTFGADAWSTPRRAPRLYPDAVTLDPAATAVDLLARIDASAGCSIKDSFATLDLASHGLHVLFAAEWIWCAPGSSDTAGDWSPVADAQSLADWAAAWGDDDAPADLFRAALLDNPSVVVLARRVNDDIVAGAILNLGANVVGVSNLFTTNGDVDAAWSSAITAAHARFPNLPIVGYEAGDDLAAACRSGFATFGELRVWISAPPRR